MAATFECRVPVVVFVVFLLIISGYSINLDARFSVIKKGEENSYFGYSVAQHQIVNDANDDGTISPEEAENVEENVLLVGAPKQKVEVGGHTFGGAVYRCNAANPAQDECRRIDDGVYLPPRTRWRVEDQWLGVSVASAGRGKKAVACAHRFIKDNAALGRCHVFMQSLEELRFHFRPCEGQPHNQYMRNFGLCQAGMSASLGQDDSLMMGAPGSVFWQGTVFLTNVSEEYGVSQTEIPSPSLESTAVSADEQPTPVKHYSYQGYSSDMGRFDGTKALYYVSGAPNSQSHGEIIFYRKIDSSTLRYEKNQIIRGKLPFSGFGSSLLVLDFNHDGFDDLIVGAPYYYKRYHGGAIYVYRGGPKMFTKDTEPIEILSRKMGDEECQELRCEHAQFGVSLSKLGDINMDGFQDFAVGAPYEGNGVVYIYHGDDSDAGFTTNYVQRIVASDLPIPELKSFGYSLSGGIDLDGNGYPDLLVGAYESDTVALIRSRPIIRIHPSLSVSPTLIDLDAVPRCDLPGVKDEYKNTHCVGVKLCLNFTTKPENSLTILPKVIYTLEAEKPRRIARVELQDAQDVNKKVVEGKTMDLDPSSTVCTTEIAIIKSSFDDKLNPISFTYAFSLSTDTVPFTKEYPDSAREDINNHPILDTESSIARANTIPVEVDFVKECGDDNKCISNLQFTSQLLSPVDDLEKIGENVFEMVIKAKNELTLVLGVKNQGEAAYLTRIFVRKPAKVSYQGIKATSTVTCNDSKHDDTLVICNHVGNPLREEKSVYFNMLLVIPREMAESDEMYNITSWVNTSSSESTPLNDEVVHKFRLINKAEIEVQTNVIPDGSIVVQGEPRGASAIKDENMIGASVKHNFIVTNTGPGVISESYITIYWPFEVSRDKGGPGKYLLYPTKKPTIVGQVEKCNDEQIMEYINPLNIKEVQEDGVIGASKDADIPIQVKEVQPIEKSKEETNSSRSKREAQPLKQERGNVVVLDCRDKSAHCFEIKCKLGKLEANNDFAKITVHSRLWESTLLSDYRKAAEVQMISWAELTLPERLKIQQDTRNDKRRAITRAVPYSEETSKQALPWWVILASVLGGIIVLLIVIFILYKLGFFRRKRPEEMQMYRAEKTTQLPMLKDYEEDEA